MAVCDPNVFGILAGRDGCRRVSHEDDRSGVYFGSRRNINDKKYHAKVRKKEKKRE